MPSGTYLCNLVGEMKQKNLVGVDGRNRRVLQDIGNLANGRAGVQAKVIKLEVLCVVFLLKGA